MLDFKFQLDKTKEYGVVSSIQPPVVFISGLPGAKLHELVIFENNDLGEIFSLDQETSVVLSFSKNPPQVGSKLTRLDRAVEVPLGKELLGRGVDPLGNVIFGEKFKVEESRPIDNAPLGLEKRVRVTEPLLTGITIVDFLVPLGRGQKELILGDYQRGKTSFALTVARYQMETSDTVVIYAGVGRKKTELAYLFNQFLKERTLSKMVIISTSAQDSPGLIFLTPYTAMTVAEYFRDLGKNVLLIIDDLSTHARFYREISLLTRRFPGRDSYPGDMFYTHSKLLERAGNFKFGEKPSSITVLPITQTVEGDLTGYITTNLISITDGHIYFDNNLYNLGKRPAINVALSVTRLGNQTQPKLISEINHQLQNFLTHYEKTLSLSHFGAELSTEARRTLVIGESLNNFFYQEFQRFTPLVVELTLLTMIWEEFIGLSEIADIEKMRESLTNAYFSKRENKELLDNFLLVPKFDDLQIEVEKNLARIKELCGIKSS